MITLNRLFYLKLFLVASAIFAVRIWLINTFGGTVPYWDEWDAEAVYTLIPWFDGHLSLNTLIAPHNEHRLFFTRIFSLILLIINDNQWDPLVQMVFCAALATLTAIILALILKKLLGERGYNTTLFAIALLGIIPFAAENIIWGLQINWYFFNLFSLLAFWGVLLHREGSWQWWLGIFCAFCTYFNLVSGIFVVAILLLVKSYLWLVDKKHRESHLISLTALVVLLVIEIALFSDFAGHAVLRHQAAAAHGFWNLFFDLLGKYLAFPFIKQPFFSLIIYLPVLLLTFTVFIQRRAPNALELFSLTLGGWVILQSAAIAYGRLWVPEVPSRYMDILALGTVANLMALYALYDLLPARYNRLVQFYGILWAVVWCGTLTLLVEITPFLQAKQLEKVDFLRNVRNYLTTQSVTSLQNVAIPYPVPQRLADILANPKLRASLPVNLQIPQLIAAEKNEGVFGADQIPIGMAKYPNEIVWGSAGLTTSGTFVSAPITIKQAYLQIPLSGYLGTPGLRLELIVEGKPPIVITPPKLIRETWENYYVRAPAEPFRIVATDQEINSWFAFATPRGVGILSFWTIQLLRYANQLFYGSLGLLLALIFWYSYLRPEYVEKTAPPPKEIQPNPSA